MGTVWLSTDKMICFVVVAGIAFVEIDPAVHALVPSRLTSRL
jgi:hypothetical protein